MIQREMRQSCNGHDAEWQAVNALHIVLDYTNGGGGSVGENQLASSFAAARSQQKSIWNFQPA